jgi:hypothetical protein
MFSRGQVSFLVEPWVVILGIKYTVLAVLDPQTAALGVFRLTVLRVERLDVSRLVGLVALVWTL